MPSMPNNLVLKSLDEVLLHCNLFSFHLGSQVTLLCHIALPFSIQKLIISDSCMSTKVLAESVKLPQTHFKVKMYLGQKKNKFKIDRADIY